MTGHHVSEINPWHRHQISWNTNTSRVSGLCWPRQRRQGKSAMQELKQGLACDALKAAMPQHRVQNTNRNQKERKGCCWGDGSGQVALLSNTSHCEITDWTVKTLAEQSPKDTGAEGSKIRSARQLMNLHLCVSSGHKYILQQVVEKIRPIVLFRRGSARQSSWMQREGRRETVMCSPPSETAAALPSSRITPNPDSDLTRAGLCTQ